MWPWRKDRTAYRVWVAEVMLQQTVLAAVAPRFEEWVRRFPDVRALAGASEREVVRAWEGLGYYRRARNLHAAARRIVAEHGGEVPSDPEVLRGLPGFGDYTAAAVASIAFGRRVVAVDANVRRIVMRLRGWRSWGAARTRTAKAWLASLMPSRCPGDFNEALMELGQTLCRPGVTDCGRCPLRGVCATARRGGLRRRRGRRPRPGPTELRSFALVALRGREVLLRPGRGGLFEGLWTLPRYAAWPRRFRRLAKVGEVTHTYTRFRERLEVWLAELRGGARKEDGVFVDLDEAERFPMPSAHRRALKMGVRGG